MVIGTTRSRFIDEVAFKCGCVVEGGVRLGVGCFGAGMVDSARVLL
jgi:nitrogenase subunit NifH